MSLLKSSFNPDLVSVIVPTYNRAHLIESTLDSVYKQTYRPIELIVVDDGSSDNTRKFVDAWKSDKAIDNRFSVVYLFQENQGPSIARNHGLSKCSGQYIQFLDSDDIVHNEKLAVQVAVMREKNVDFCVCNYQTFDDNVNILGPVVSFYHRSHATEDFPISYPMNTPCPLYSREAIMHNGPWDESLSAGEDFEYNFRMVVGGMAGHWIDRVLLFVRKHSGEERIQSTPLAERFQSMYVGLVKMEAEAIQCGRCSGALQNSLGLRAYQYYRHTKTEGSLVYARAYLMYAWPRLRWSSKVKLIALRILPSKMTKMFVAVKRVCNWDQG